jgi:DNA invertase Pin-like site-specific DNA recombinase
MQGQPNALPPPGVHYASRSQEEEPGKDSTGDQLRELCERFGEPVAEYTDHASGYSGNRGEGLERAMAHAARLAGEHGRSELRVVKSERFARGSGRKDEARSVLEVFVEMRRAGVDLRSVHDDAFLTNSMLVGVANEMAHKYSRDLSAHVKRGIAGRNGKGLPWGEPGYGYRKGDDGHWAEDPAESAIARRVYRLRVDEGLSYNAIATLLNREGVPTRRGSRWTATVVRRLVTSRHALGFYWHAREWYEGQHDAIIDQATWDAAQALADRDRKYAPKGGGGRLPKQHVFIRGMLRCGWCKAAMLPRSDSDTLRLPDAQGGRGCVRDAGPTPRGRGPRRAE